MKKSISAILAVIALSGCKTIPPAVLDPLVQACVTDLSQWSVIISTASSMGLTATQLATAVCEIPAILAPYAQKQANAKDLAEKAYTDLKVGDIKSVETPITTDAGVAK